MREARVMQETLIPERRVSHAAEAGEWVVNVTHSRQTVRTGDEGFSRKPNGDLVSGETCLSKEPD